MHVHVPKSIRTGDGKNGIYTHTHAYTHISGQTLSMSVVMYRCTPSDTHQRLGLHCGVGVASPADQWAPVQGGAPQHYQWRERVCVLHVVICSAAVTTHSIRTGCCRRSGFTFCGLDGEGGPAR